MSGFGERVTALREAWEERHDMRFSEAELARKAGVEPALFNKWIRKKEEPRVPLEVAARIAKSLEVNFVDLMDPAEVKRLGLEGGGSEMAELDKSYWKGTAGSRMLEAIGRLELDAKDTRERINAMLDEIERLRTFVLRRAAEREKV